MSGVKARVLEYSLGGNGITIRASKSDSCSYVRSASTALDTNGDILVTWWSVELSIRICTRAKLRPQLAAP